MITVAEAVHLLNDGDRIHTFRNGNGTLVGADHDRKRLIKQIEKYKSTLQIAGEAARGMKHALILEDEHGYLFIETNEEKLNAFDPLLVKEKSK